MTSCDRGEMARGSSIAAHLAVGARARPTLSMRIVRGRIETIFNCISEEFFRATKLFFRREAGPVSAGCG